jgi:hypothetical protein
VKGKVKQTLLFDKNCKLLKGNPGEKKNNGNVPPNQKPAPQPNPSTGQEKVAPKK